MSQAELHPLRGVAAVAGGLFAGLGAGLALGNVPAWTVSGLGAGLLLCSVLRAFGKW